MSIFFKNNKEQKEYVWEKTVALYPKFKTGGYFFRKYLNEALKNRGVVLDAGCGSGGIIKEFRDEIDLLIGIDKDRGALENNLILDRKIIGDLKIIPLSDDSVDVVISEFVLEHLDKPENVFREIRRVLKPGGKFIFITPNILNPIMILSKIFPHTLHSFLRKELLRKKDGGHPTYYKANRRGRLLKIGREVGFKNLEITRVGNPEYLGFCKPLVSISIFFEKMIDNKILRIFKMYLVGCGYMNPDKNH